MKPVPVQLEDILTSLQTMRLAIPFMPADDASKALILMSLRRMVRYKHELDWLSYAASNTLKAWSLPELRGLFCSRFTPADGIYVASTLPGFTPKDVVRASAAIPESPAALLLGTSEPEPTSEERTAWAELDARIKASARRKFGRLEKAPRRPSLSELEAQARQWAANVIERTPEERERIERNLKTALGVDVDESTIH